MKRSLLTCVAFAATLSLQARADVAPPADYKDPCKSVHLDDTCQRCIVPEFKGPICHENARKSGLIERCRGWNYAMYCKPASPSSPPAPQVPAATTTPASPTVTTPPPPAAPTPRPSRCTIQAGPTQPGAALFVALMLAVTVARRIHKGRSLRRG